MPTLYTHRAANVQRTWLLMGAFVVLLAILGWGFAYALESPVLFVVAVGIAFLTTFASYWYADRLVVALAGARPLAKQDDPELSRVVENLSIAAGLPLPKLYLIDDPAPNAFATGRDPKHAVVAVTRGLRQRLEKSELEGVIAHELSHIGNRDILVATVAAILTGVLVTLADFFFRLSFSGSRRDRGHGGVFLLGIILAAIFAPLAATLIRLAISRQREYLADASGVLLTRHPEGLARALEKIGAANLSLRRAPDAIAHLWCAEPEPRRKTAKFFSRLFATHPPIPDRLRRLRSFSG